MVQLLTRSLSGLVYVLVILIALFSPPYGVIFLALFLGTAAILEWMQFPGKPNLSQPTALMLGIFFLALYRNSSLFLLDPDPTKMSELLLAILVISLMTTQVFGKKRDLPRSLFHSVFGLVYITIPLCLLLHIGEIQGDYNPWIPASIFILIWTADTFAYLTGKFLGKHKLIPSISPQKTWEGFLGAIGACILAAFLLAQFLDFMPWPAWLGLGLVVVLFGAVGDLFESALKRAYELKDSGNFMPGHGGVLDRIDSLQFALPMAYFYLEAIHQFL